MKHLGKHEEMFLSKKSYAHPESGPTIFDMTVAQDA